MLVVLVEENEEEEGGVRGVVPRTRPHQRLAVSAKNGVAGAVRQGMRRARARARAV